MTRPLIRFAIFFLAFATLPAAVNAQSHASQPRDYVFLKPDEAQQLLANFRDAKLAGDFCFRVAITHQQRKGDQEITYDGTLWGTWGNGGPLFRIELKKTGDADANARRFILQSGPTPALWILDKDGKPTRSTDATLTPLFPGLIFTPFELQTPFTYWPEAQYLRTVSFKGRPTNLFKMMPPESFKKSNPGISHVQLGFDRAYNALMQAVIYDGARQSLRTLHAEGFRKVQEQYIPEEISLRDDKTRDRDIFRVTAAAMNLKLPKSVFEPETLTAPAPVLTEKLFTILD